jgi:hypothetical protein
VTLKEVLHELAAAGLRLSSGPSGSGTIIASPRERLTDELRALIRENKAPLLAELLAQVQVREPAHADGESAPGPDAPPRPAPSGGSECMRCANLSMRVEHHQGTRRVFWWRCTRGHALLEGRNYGERVMLAPPDCHDFKQRQAGQR